MTMTARVAEVSASGRGAVATLRVWGPGALAIADAAFRPAKPGGRTLAETPVNRLRVGRIGAGLGDEVVAVVLGLDPPEVEIQCHGGAVAVALVVDALVEQGAERVGPKVWARDSTGSTIRGDAGAALAEASTLKVASILLDQSQGALEAELDRVAAALDSSDPKFTLSLLDGLIERGAFGVRLLEGWRVVLAGRPNAGKSRLLNALAGFDRAIVAPTPGTTRDVVTTATAMGGWPVEVADTAGLRAATDPIEREGVRLARDRQRGADLVVVVLDRSEPITPEDRAILLDYPGALVVANKSDLPSAWHERGSGASLSVSAERGDGVEALVGAIVDRLALPVPPAGSGVPFRSVHVRRLRAIRGRVEAGDVLRARRSLARWLGHETASVRGGSPT